MSAKEKAYELVGKFLAYSETSVFPKSNQEHEFTNNPQFENARKCSIVTVNEIIKEFDYNSKHDNKQGYWQQVKKEIELL